MNFLNIIFSFPRKAVATTAFWSIIITLIAANIGTYKVGAFVLGATPVSSLNPEETGPYFQGDIILAPTTFSGRVDPKYRWQNKTVYYEIDEKYPSQLRATFLLAIDHIAERTCLKFQPRHATLFSTPIPSDYVYVTGSLSKSCYSYVGRQGGRQVVSLPQNCHNLGTFIHELLHAVGFHHEQSRTDRDEHVTIIWENVQPGKESQFRQYDAATVSSFGVPYDYGSVMHYGRFAFSKDARRLETIMPLEVAVIGQRKGMSERDAEKVNKMYDC